MNLCSEILKPELGFDLCELLYPGPQVQELAKTRLAQTQYIQPALFAVEYALARTWMKWGVQPDCMVGHSIGEYTAACLAGVFSLQAALRLVAARGRLMQQPPSGAMTGVMLPEDDIKTLLVQHPGVSLAANNGPSACVISGAANAVVEVEQRLDQVKVPYARLHVGCAPHSPEMDVILPAFRTELEKTKLNPPKLRYMSNVTGGWIKPSDAQNSEYWIRHLRYTVNFYEAARELLKTPRRIFLEVGPGHTLTSLIAQYPQREVAHVSVCSLPHPRHESQDSFAFILNAVGQLWLEGCDFDWLSFYAGETRRRIPLPAYPFERHYYRIAAGRNRASSVAGYERTNGNASAHELATAEETASRLNGGHGRPLLSSPFVRPSNQFERILAEIWENTLGIRELGIHDNFVELGGHSLVAIQLTRRISEAFAIPFKVEHLYEAPTIAKTATLAARLLGRNLEAAAVSGKGHNQEAPVYPGVQLPLVPIRATGARQPLFLVHPGGGGVKVYQQLAKYLDPNQPIYAFQCHVLGSHKAHPLIPVEEMASHYIRSLRPVQPAGPYLLAGWSNGGVIAFEMAIQLQRLGEEVSLVGIFDAASRHHPEPEPKSAASRLTEDILFTGEALATREGQKFTLKKEDLEHLREEDQFEKFLQELRSKELVPPEVDAEALRALLETFTNTNKAMEYYIPGMYHGRVLVLRAREVTPDLRELTRDIYDDPSFGWQQYCSQPVDVRNVPGDHMHMAAEPNIQVLGAVFQRCIDEELKN
jgi:phthiocerol/phenolphthiocerol synthesis type-I polyketide synthase E